MSNYSEFVNNRCKDGDDLVASFTAEKAELNHYAIGIASEAGELLDAVKRFVIYNKPLDLRNVIEELGDIEFFAEALRQKLNLTRGEVINENVRKLSKRYPDVYTDDLAAQRLDKDVR